MDDSTDGKTPEPIKKKKAPHNSKTKGGNSDAGPTYRQLAFIDYYLACRNATQAAKQAGYSESGASVQGHQLLNNTKVRAEINKRIEALRVKTSLTPDSLIEKLREYIYDKPGTKDTDVLKAIHLAGSYFGMWDGLGKSEGGAPNRRDALTRFRALLKRTE